MPGVTITMTMRSSYKRGRIPSGGYRLTNNLPLQSLYNCYHYRTQPYPLVEGLVTILALPQGSIS